MAGSGGPVEFFVEVEELGRLRGELQTLESELGDLPAEGMTADGSAMGGEDVAGACDRFAVHWTDGRVRITENVGQCRALAAGAAEAYTGAENAIQNAAPVAAGPVATEAR
jgi:hypothetical protein